MTSPANPSTSPSRTSTPSSCPQKKRKPREKSWDLFTTCQAQHKSNWRAWTRSSMPTTFPSPNSAQSTCSAPRCSTRVPQLSWFFILLQEASCTSANRAYKRLGLRRRTGSQRPLGIHSRSIRGSCHSCRHLEDYRRGEVKVGINRTHLNIFVPMQYPAMQSQHAFAWLDFF